ncbi:MAG: DUF4363 family protein [Clostridiales bacterium]|uniref:DUF4363 family protein n=1 Tax=Anaerocaecibacter muris TaxID=2941513 RepID=UPI00203A7CC0|nr:DUF4363 family protein [Anaerocaecibacter muris]MDE6966286.1 DUF4363 family protein [Clostridiales bacterium]
MKKVIVIVVVFLIMIGGMIGEITYVNKFYNGLQADLEAIAQSIDENEEHVQNPQTEQLCDAMLKKWEKGKRALLMLQNHNTVRNLDDKLVSLAAVVGSDNYNDAVIFVQSAINYIDDVLLDSVPFLSNIL